MTGQKRKGTQQVAKQVITSLIDDIDGSPADETLGFALDGIQYEIDLNNKNGKKVRDFLSTYIEAGTRVGKTGSPAQLRRHQPQYAPTTDREVNRKIRQWAIDNDYEVSERGRIPQTIIDAYNAQTVVQTVKGTSKSVSFRKP